jgi:hypothetical protein
VYTTHTHRERQSLRKRILVLSAGIWGRIGQ